MKKNNKKRIFILGLTGGIASGKSTILNEFKKLGAEIIDSDKIAHEIIIKNKTCYEKIVNNFGRKILNHKNQIDRKKLGKVVFSDVKKRKLLEKIIHPIILNKIKNKIKCLYKKLTTNSIIVIDLPLLFEAGLQKMVDKILVVWVPQKIQINRLMKRDKLSYNSALKRIKSQIPLEKKLKLADYVIDNTKKYSEIKRQVYNIWSEMKIR